MNHAIGRFITSKPKQANISKIDFILSKRPVELEALKYACQLEEEKKQAFVVYLLKKVINLQIRE